VTAESKFNSRELAASRELVYRRELRRWLMAGGRFDSRELADRRELIDNRELTERRGQV